MNGITLYLQNISSLSIRIHILLKYTWIILKNRLNDRTQNKAQQIQEHWNHLLLIKHHEISLSLWKVTVLSGTDGTTARFSFPLLLISPISPLEYFSVVHFDFNYTDIVPKSYWFSWAKMSWLHLKFKLNYCWIWCTSNGGGLFS